MCHFTWTYVRSTNRAASPELLLLYTRGLVAQLTTFDYTASPESYTPPGLCFPPCVLDTGPTGSTSLPLAPTLAQIGRKPEVLAGRSQDILLGNALPALSGYDTAAMG